jgi:hypothetical protein
MAKATSGEWALAIDGGLVAKALINADSTTPVSVITGAANGSQVYEGQFWSNETAANTVTVYYAPAAGTTVGTVQYPLFTYPMPAASTNADGIAYSAMAASTVCAPGAMKDNAGNRYYQLNANDQIFVGLKTAVATTAGKQFVVSFCYRDFKAA